MERFVIKNKKLQKRKKSIRKRISGTTERPRVAIFRSNKHLYAQIIDDVQGKTLAGISDSKVTKGKLKPIEIAKKLGTELGEKAKKAKVTKVVFDRSGYKYHGRIQALADGLREAGLEF